MKAARSQKVLVDWSSPNLKVDGKEACKKQIVAFIQGIRGPRKNPVNEKQIMEWVSATPREFVDDCMVELILDGVISSRRNSINSNSFVYQMALQK